MPRTEVPETRVEPRPAEPRPAESRPQEAEPRPVEPRPRPPELRPREEPRPEPPKPRPVAKKYATPEQAWEVTKRESGRPLLQDAAFLSFQDGVLTLAVRSERNKRMVEGSAADVEFALWFPGFRQLSIRVEATGQTGIERQQQQNSERRQLARQAARDSAAVKTFAELMGATLEVEAVEPPPQPEEAIPEPIEMDGESV